MYYAENLYVNESKFSILFVTDYSETVPTINNVNVIPYDLPILEREGYDFEGWYLDSNFSVKAIEGTKLESNIILYAKWTKIEEHLHIYSNPTYMWTDDFSTVTATRVCIYDSNHIETETVYSISKIVQELSCTSDEITKFKSSFNNIYFEDQVKEIVTRKAQHTYSNETGYCIYGCGIYCSIGLEMTLSSDESYYIVSGIGNCTEKHITIPATYNGLPIKEIGDKAFFGCNYIESIIFKENLLTIGSSSFRECTNLSKVTLNSNLNFIGDRAFKSCINLTSIIIPASVTKIGEYCFQFCYKLVEVYNLSSLLFTLNSRTKGYISKYAKIIHNSLEQESILKYIDNYVFYTTNYQSCLISYNGNEENLILPESYKDEAYIISDYAFYNKKIINLKITNGVTSIGSCAFYDCTKLKTITLPKILTTIGQNAFYNCVDLENVYYLGIIEDWCKIKFDDIYSNPMVYATHYYLKNLNNEYYEINSIEIPKSISKLFDYVFLGFENVISIKVPNSITEIGSQIFYGCNNLEKIYIPFVGDLNSYSNFGYIFGATSYSSNIDYVPKTLKEVYLTSNANINSFAFYLCNNIKKITLSNSISSIVSYTFAGCSI